MSRDLAFVVNPRTLKLDVALRNGEPFGDDSRLYAVMSRLAAVRGKWWADEAGTYGRRDRGRVLRQTAVSELESDVHEALAPLVAAREILPPRGAQSIGVDVTVNKAAGRALIVVTWSTPSGAEQVARHSMRF